MTVRDSVQLFFFFLVTRSRSESCEAPWDELVWSPAGWEKGSLSNISKPVVQSHPSKCKTTWQPRAAFDPMAGVPGLLPNWKGFPRQMRTYCMYGVFRQWQESASGEMLGLLYFCKIQRYKFGESFEYCHTWLQYTASKSVLAFLGSCLLRQKPSTTFVFCSGECPNVEQIKSYTENVKSSCFLLPLRHWERGVFYVQH